MADRKTLSKPYGVLLAVAALGFGTVVPRELELEEMLVFAVLAVLLVSGVLLVVGQRGARPTFLIGGVLGFLTAAYTAFVGGLELLLDREIALANGWGWLFPAVLIAAAYLVLGFFVVLPRAHHQRSQP